MGIKPKLDVQKYGMWPLLQRSFNGGLLLAPAPWQIVRANAIATECLGTSERSLLGRRAVELFDDATRNAAMELVQRAWVDDAGSDSVIATITGDAGATQRVELRASALDLEGERLVGLIFRVVAMDEGAALGESYRSDPLTGVRDRNFLTARLNTLLREGQGSDRKFAILFVDLDNFKAVNDRFGHLVGDRVLREAARRIAACVGKHEVVRYGGDEFVVVVEAGQDTNEAKELAARIRTVIAPPIELVEGGVALSVSVGIAWTLPEVRTPDDLIAAADRAMYAAKRGT